MFVGAVLFCVALGCEVSEKKCDSSAMRIAVAIVPGGRSQSAFRRASSSPL